MQTQIHHSKGSVPSLLLWQKHQGPFTAFCPMRCHQAQCCRNRAVEWQCHWREKVRLKPSPVLSKPDFSTVIVGTSILLSSGCLAKFCREESLHSSYPLKNSAHWPSTAKLFLSFSLCFIGGHLLVTWPVLCVCPNPFQ